MTPRTYTPLGIVLLLVFAGFSYSTFQDTLTPYVSYAEAIQGGNVQVAGGLVPDTASYDGETSYLHFTLFDPDDKSQRMRVRYSGLKPANFEEAISIVAIGQYDAAADEFAASKLLVKCPSKYQGLDESEVQRYDGSELYDPAQHQAPRAGDDATGYGTDGYGAKGYSTNGYGSDGDARSDYGSDAAPDADAAPAPITSSTAAILNTT
ncbi:MAG: cytochrome c maturation protein CcmE [Acidobacteriota bacterium]